MEIILLLPLGKAINVCNFRESDLHVTWQGIFGLSCDIYLEIANLFFSYVTRSFIAVFKRTLQYRAVINIQSQSGLFKI
jgi:hypothetical protein